MVCLLIKHLYDDGAPEWPLEFRVALSLHEVYEEGDVSPLPLPISSGKHTHAHLVAAHTRVEGHGKPAIMQSSIFIIIL